MFQNISLGIYTVEESNICYMVQNISLGIYMHTYTQVFMYNNSLKGYCTSSKALTSSRPPNCSKQIQSPWSTIWKTFEPVCILWWCFLLNIFNGHRAQN